MIKDAFGPHVASGCSDEERDSPSTSVSSYRCYCVFSIDITVPFSRQILAINGKNALLEKSYPNLIYITKLNQNVLDFCNFWLSSLVLAVETGHLSTKYFESYTSTIKQVYKSSLMRNIFNF